MPWILEEVEDKVEKVCEGQPLESLELVGLDCKSHIANQVLDFMAN